MSDYKNIRGKKIKFFTTDLSSEQSEGQLFYSDTDNQFKTVVASAAWSSGGNLITAVQANAGAGASTQNAGLGFGGYLTPGSARTNETVEYDGTGFSLGGNLPNSPASLNGAGTQSAGLAFGGAVPPGTVNTNVKLQV